MGTLFRRNRSCTVASAGNLEAQRVALIFVRVRPRQPQGCAGASYEDSHVGKLQHGGVAPSHSSGFRMRACCVQAFRQRPREDRRLHSYGDLHRLSVASWLVIILVAAEHLDLRIDCRGVLLPGAAQKTTQWLSADIRIRNDVITSTFTTPLGAQTSTFSARVWSNNASVSADSSSVHTEIPVIACLFFQICPIG